MRKNTTVFKKILKKVKKQFQNIVNRHKGDHYKKSFKCFNLLSTVLYAQLLTVSTLGELAQATKANDNLVSTSKSTLSRDLMNKNYKMFIELLHKISAEINPRNLSPLQQKELRDLVGIIQILDSTTIPLNKTLYPWAEYKETKSAIKLHQLLDLFNILPEKGIVTAGSVSDVELMTDIMVEKDVLYVTDRGYIDYEKFDDRIDNAIDFLIRLKVNAVYEVLEDYQIPEEYKDKIIRDQKVILGGTQTRMKHALRLTIFKDDEGKLIKVATTRFDISVELILLIYKCRWQVELFFKWIKQNLQIKRFLGTSPNAVMIQLSVAFILYFLLYFIMQKINFRYTLLKVFWWLKHAANKQVNSTALWSAIIT